MASLESRISKAEDDGKPSWADETSAADADKSSSPTKDTIKDNAKQDANALSKAQTDGATEALNGGSGIYEPSYEVNVKLSDLQADPNNPLNSIKSFEDLGL